MRSSRAAVPTEAEGSSTRQPCWLHSAKIAPKNAIIALRYLEAIPPKTSNVWEPSATSAGQFSKENAINSTTLGAVNV